jgi:hypothetical protein
MYFDMTTNRQLMGEGKKQNYSHNWMLKVALHCDASNNCRWKKVAAL